MKKVLYVRHGQSETNLRGVFAGGNDDTRLTDLGREQAKNAGKELKGIKIDRIICSPLSRTYETAQIIAKELGLSVNKIQKDERLKEYDVGTGNGTPIEGKFGKQIILLFEIYDTQTKKALTFQSSENMTKNVIMPLILKNGTIFCKQWLYLLPMLTKYCNYIF